MTDMTNAIVRTWSATASSAGADEYSRYFATTLLPELRKLPGFTGAYLLRRELSDANGTNGADGHDGAADGRNVAITELTAHTFWESAAAIKAFAGDDVTVAIVEPEAQAMLLDFDRTAAHRNVVVNARE